MKKVIIVCYFLLANIKGLFGLRVLGITVPHLKQRGESASLTCDFDLEGGKLYSVKWYRDTEEFYRYMPRLRPPQHAHRLDGVKVDRGESASLTCDFDLEGGKLYSVKWYRDTEEFYRYMPRLRPPQHAHRLDGVKVDLDKSSARRVHLRDLTLRSRGLYRCEVSEEAPSFHSAQAEGYMEVYYFPRESPYITGHERPYRLDQPLDVNCSSAMAFPAPDLQWLIDGQKVTERSWLIAYGAKPALQGLLVSTLGLTAPAKPNMKLRCIAVIGTHRRERSIVIETNSSSLLQCCGLVIIATITVFSITSPKVS